MLLRAPCRDVARLEAPDSPDGVDGEGISRMKKSCRSREGNEAQETQSNAPKTDGRFAGEEITT